jgi:hypothetical protein
MRYKDTGELHRDFHLATDTSIRYILRAYGIDVLRRVFRQTAQNVYGDIYRNLKAGNAKPLREHFEYYMSREGGEYTRTETSDGTTYKVSRCPAVEHLVSRGYTWSEQFCLQTRLLNEGWAEGTPFDIATEVVGEGRCVQTIRRKDASQ